MYRLVHIIENKSFKETIWSFLTKGSTIILFFFLNIVLARMLGVKDFGTWSFFLSIITIVYTISYFGINASIQKFIAQHNQTAELRSVLRDGFKIRLLFSLGAVGIFSLLAWPLSIWIERPEFFTFFLLALPLIFFASLTQFFKSSLMGLHRIKYNLIINLCEHGGKVIILLLLFLISISIENVIIAFSLAFALASVVGAWMIYHIFYKHLPQSQNRYTSAILRYSLPLFFISLGFLLLTEVDTMMLGILTNDNEVGIYAVPKQISIKVPQIALALAMGSMPVFAQLSSDNKERLQKLFQKLLLINSGIMLIFLIGVFGLGHWLIPLIFGESYMASVPVLYVLSLYIVMTSFSIIFSQFLDYQGYAQKRAWNLSIAMISNIILNFILIPEYGALGAGIGTTLSYLPYMMLNSLEVYNVFRKY